MNKSQQEKIDKRKENINILLERVRLNIYIPILDKFIPGMRDENIVVSDEIPSIVKIQLTNVFGRKEWIELFFEPRTISENDEDTSESLYDFWHNSKRFSMLLPQDIERNITEMIEAKERWLELYKAYSLDSLVSQYR